MAFTARQVETAKPKEKSYKFFDGGGLYLEVTAKGSSYWRMKYRFGEEHQCLQKNLIKGGLSGKNTKGKRAHTRSVNGIDGDIKLNKALWVITKRCMSIFQEEKEYR
ncbi:hypothetical protein M997_0233 [Proteus hauseri ATCC 700826]|uniref:Integrase DNA-binding domain-containing protein n=1 Tax=Proteus hauseri ATCC 700826 TaxID=1354271 RepID=A0AAJ3HUX3_PROHU|nr:hypothetical protein M997_0233 [Proteus hauseri ATCC 700826]